MERFESMYSSENAARKHLAELAKLNTTRHNLKKNQTPIGYVYVFCFTLSALGVRRANGMSKYELDKVNEYIKVAQCYSKTW